MMRISIRALVRSGLCTVALALLGVSAHAQVSVPGSGSNSISCGNSTTLLDPGGTGDYANNQDGYTVLNSGGTAVISINGSYSVESCCDHIYVYNGAGTGGTLLTQNSGGTGTLTYTGTPGQTLTVRFTSDVSLTSSGMSLAITYSGTCPGFLVPATGFNTVACGDSKTLVQDPGGDGNYADNSDGYTVFQAANSSVITISGTYDLEGCCDHIYVYNGTGTGGTLVAQNSGSSGSLSFVGAPGQTLTLRFVSDVSLNFSGFNLSVTYSGSCLPPTTLVPYSGSNSVACGNNTLLQDHAGGGVYDNNANGYTVLNAQGTASISISGTYEIEGCCDHIYIYNGAGTGGTLLAQNSGASGTLTYNGAAGQTLTVQFTSDVSLTYSGMNLNVTYNNSCFLDCVPPVATGTRVLDCPNNRFYVSVNVTSVGDGGPVTIVNTGGAPTVGPVGVGTYQIGPFTPITTSTSVSVNHGSSVNCNIALGTYTGNGVLCNDNCVDATLVTCGSSVPGTNVGATDDGVPNQAPGGEATVNNGVWYKILGDGSQVTTSVCGTASFDSRISVFSGSCGALLGVGGSDDDCGSASTVTFNTSPGVMYYIAVEGYQLNAGTFTLNTTCVAACSPALANEDCGTAQPVTIGAPGSCASSINSSTNCAAATNVGNTGCFSTFATLPDAWFSFTPTSATTEMILTFVSPASLGYALYSGSCGSLSLIQCSAAATSGSVNLLSLSAGTYYLRVLSTAATKGDFTLCMRQFAVPAQDACPGVNLSTLTSPYPATTSGSNADFTLPCGSTSLSADHVYYIDVPDQNTLRIGDQSSSYDATHQLLSGPTCPGSASLACSTTDLQQESYANTSGSTQRLWWIQDGDFGASGSYTLQWALLNCVEPVATASVQVINCATTPQYYVNVNLTSLGNASSVDITSDQAIGNVPGVTTPGIYQIGPFAAGSTAVVTVVHNGNNACNKALGSFFVPSNPLCNDNCGDAVPIACGNSYTGTNVGATADPYPSQAAGGETTIDNGVWYVLTGTDEQVNISLCNSNFDTRIHVFRGSCGALIGVAGNDDDCSTRSTVNFPSLIGNTYYIAVEGYGTASGTIDMVVSCGSLCQPFATNNDCADRQTITMEANCSPVSGNLSCATSTAGTNPGCTSLFNTYPDVYYDFVATGPEVYVNLTYSNPGIFFVLYDGCGGTEITCQSTTSGVPTLVTGLTQGNTYVLRIMQIQANAGSFTLCLQKLDVSDDPCTPVALSCDELRFGRTVGRANNIPAGSCPFNGAASTGGVNYFSYTAEVDGDVTFSTCGSTTFDTRVSVYEGACSSLSCVVMSDNADGCSAGSSVVTLRALAGHTYTVLVHGAGSAEGTYQMNINCQPFCALSEGNDRCANATELPSYLSGTGTPLVDDQSCAYMDAPNACSGANGVQGVWYTFNSGANTRYDLHLRTHADVATLTSTTISYALYSGGCSGVGALDEITCQSPASGSYPLPTLLTNHEYRLLVYNQGGIGFEGSFSALLTHPGVSDAGIDTILAPVGTVCDNKLFPHVMLKNYGEATLNSVRILSFIDGGLVQTYDYVGAPIPSGQSVDVALPAITSPGGGHSFTATTSSPNQLTDDNPANDASTVAYSATGQTVKVRILTDNFPTQTSWLIYNSNFDVPVASVPVGGYTLPNHVYETTACLTTDVVGSCFFFYLRDANNDGLCCLHGTGRWTLLNTSDQVILEDRGQFGQISPPATPASASYTSGHEFCLPLGPAQPLPSECFVYNNVLTNKVYCKEVAGVSQYQFEFTDPDAGFRRRIAVSLRNWVKFAEMQSNPLTPGTTYFCRVRADQGILGSFTDDFFSAGCEMALAAVQPVCTQLIDNETLPTHSCGVTKRFGGSDKVYAQPVVGATQYRFRFFNGELSRTIVKPSYVCLLNWIDLPLVNGSTYNVTVECFVSGAWSGTCGATCQVTINNTMMRQNERIEDVTGTEGNELQVWPNPVVGGNVHVMLTGLAAADQQVTIDVYDLFGKRVVAESFGVSGSVLNRTIDMNGMASGVYVVNITANDQHWTQRVTVQ